MAARSSNCVGKVVGLNNNGAGRIENYESEWKVEARADQEYVETRPAITEDKIKAMGGERGNSERASGGGACTDRGRAHANLSAASRCYRGATLMSCILSVLLRAPHQCIWTIVHLSIWLATIVSSPFTWPLCRAAVPAADAPIVPHFNCEAYRPTNNEMKPVAYSGLTRSIRLGGEHSSRARRTLALRIFQGTSARDLSFFEFQAN